MLLQFLFYLLLAMCITTTQAVNAIDRPSLTPIHHIPRRLRQTRLFVPTSRATAPILSNDYHGNPLGPKAEGHTRILLNNPNRVSPANDFLEFQYICQRLMAHDRR
jgi:hypothetical protein